MTNPDLLHFIYDALPGRVVFAVGALDKVPGELHRMGGKRALVLSTPQQRAQGEDLVRRLGAAAIGLYDKAVVHVPIEIAGEAKALALSRHVDTLVTIGGGSTTGLAKAIALETDLPILAVPTTYAGSEMTTIWGITEGNNKRVGRSAKVLPKVVVYDPLLTLDMPMSIGAPSAMNSIAHSVEALYAENENPLISMVAEENIRAFGRSLPALLRDPHNLEARTEAFYASWLGGVSLCNSSMALHHKLCHALGGTFNLPHAETHSVILPQVVAYNRQAAPKAMARIARALGAGDAAEGLFDLTKTIGAPVALKDIGMKETDLDRAADLACESPYYNPRPIERGAIRALLDDAYFGRRPGPK